MFNTKNNANNSYMYGSTLVLHVLNLDVQNFTKDKILKCCKQNVSLNFNFCKRPNKYAFYLIFYDLFLHKLINEFCNMLHV